MMTSVGGDHALYMTSVGGDHALVYDRCRW